MSEQPNFEGIQGITYQRARYSLPAGWTELIRQAYEHFQAAEGTVRVEQVKPKFGEMRLYFSLPDGTQDQRAELQTTIRQLQDQSGNICQTCGREAVPSDQHKHMPPLCEWHAFMMTHTSVKAWELGEGPRQWAQQPPIKQALREPLWISQNLGQTGGSVGPELPAHKVQELFRAGLLFGARQAYRQGDRPWITLLAQVEPALALEELRQKLSSGPLGKDEKRALENLLSHNNPSIRQKALRIARKLEPKHPSLAGGPN